MKLDDFVCDICGECCRHVDIIPELAHEQTNGVCNHLDGNKCSIYESRPVVCNRYKLFDLLKDRMSEDEFMEKLIFYCKLIKSKKVDYVEA